MQKIFGAAAHGPDGGDTADLAENVFDQRLAGEIAARTLRWMDYQPVRQRLLGVERAGVAGGLAREPGRLRELLGIEQLFHLGLHLGQESVHRQRGLLLLNAAEPLLHGVAQRSR